MYDIFHVTGFDSILDIKKALRELSIEDAEYIGRGVTGSVYRIDSETIVKVFNKNITAEIIADENRRSKNAFVFGVPTAISYDMVRVGDSYGLVYELVDTKDFLDVIVKDMAHLKDHIKKFAHKIREINSIEVDENFDDMKAVNIDWLGRLEGLYCTAEEIGKLCDIINNIPDRNTFLHGDVHMGNVMLQNGEFVFIDLSDAGTGHPILDMVSMCLGFKLGQTASDEEKENSELMRWFSRDEMQLIWDTYLRSYLDTDDEAFLKKAEEQITAVTCARVLAVAAVRSGLPEELIQFFKKTVLDIYDKGLEPICF